MFPAFVPWSTFVASHSCTFLFLLSYVHPLLIFSFFMRSDPRQRGIMYFSLIRIEKIFLLASNSVMTFCPPLAGEVLQLQKIFKWGWIKS